MNNKEIKNLIKAVNKTKYYKIKKHPEINTYHIQDIYLDIYISISLKNAKYEIDKYTITIRSKNYTLTIWKETKYIHMINYDDDK